MTNGKQEDKTEVSKREEATLAFWNEHSIFEKSLDPARSTKGEFVFYDGPPFATGLPHYGHLLQSFVKDAIPRYKTMQGYRVERQWGWDCHGLPIENIVEKELGTKSKKEVLEKTGGVKQFNDLCRERIFTFIHEWERIIPRVGRWVDMEHAYRTMDFSYMESEWWAFKTLHDKGLVYEDYRSMHICPRCETTLSQSEVAEEYKDTKDLSATVKFKVKNPEKIGLSGNVYLLAWTTTPWTLPGNVALAVGKKIEYVVSTRIINNKSETIIVGREQYEKPASVFVVDADNPIPTSYLPEYKKGKDLVGLEYEPPFDFYSKDEKLKNHENGWKVYAADFVTTDAGAGIVHIAPAFGADDMALGKQENLPFVQHVKMDGTFVDQTGEFAGLDLKPRAKNNPAEIREADLAIVRHLEKEGKLFSSEKYEHPYPHCWRCDTALLNYATSSWFVAVENLKVRLLETAKNINWSPAHIKEGRFGQWLEGARDWSISRQRFWANTIPVWRCEKCRKDRVFGSAAELAEASGTLVQDLHKEVVDEVAFVCECGGTMKRTSDVLDTWFDSGSVPFATKGYGADNAAHAEALIPADFIGEAQDQTRAWFYYLHVLSGGLFGKAAFKNCIVTGLILAEDGKKMSKKLQNYPDPTMIVEKYGADALRLYVLSSPVVQGENLNFSEKGVDEMAKKNITRLNNVLAFYKLYDSDVPRDYKSTHVLDRWILARLGQLIADTTDGYERYALDEAVRPLGMFIDDLSTWYLRRSRERFKEEGDDKVAALATLRYVLHTLARVMAPAAPFVAEYIFQIVREEEDEESVHLGTWPDASQTHFDPDILTLMETARRLVSVALEARDKAGIKVRQPLAKFSVEDAAKLSEELLALVADEVNVKEIVAGSGGLDTEVTPELKEEGKIRELIRYVQQRRKEMQLVPSDVIKIFLPESDLVRTHKAELRKTLNAKEIVYTSEWQGTKLSLEEGRMMLGVEKE